ncbi:TIGR02594 family protein [Phreatobacter sp.]|uniref:TIGR02594 family protein n=1 Tax=Phreatobacter sp. TaxID=1966341 RepID=UPI0025EECAB5|nr:TIGR02594 family protein [Phreatobacter sp.]
MIVEALKEFGTLEAPGDADNPKIIGWQEELEAAGLGRAYAAVYRHDAIPWCGLFMAIVAHRANLERRTERNPPRLYLSALEWASFGISVPKGAAALGDVLVFKRKGGGHVGLYIGHDASAFHVLGGNQSDRVTISRLSKQRLITVRRPAYRAQPANVRPIALAASGSLSVNEA